MTLGQYNRRAAVYCEGVEIAALWLEEEEGLPEVAGRLRLLKIGQLTEKDLAWATSSEEWKRAQFEVEGKVTP